MMTSVDNQLQNAYRELSDSILNLSGTNAEEVITKHEHFRQTQHKNLVNVQVNLANLAKDDSVNNPTTSHSNTSVRRGVRDVEMEKCKAPTFSGKTIDYPEFKRG